MNKAIILIGLILLIGIIGCVEPKQVSKINIDDCDVIEMREKTWERTTEQYYCAEGKCCVIYSSWGDCYLARCYLEENKGDKHE